MSERARTISLAAHAKVNLVLDLLGPRDDGYTEIATVFQTVGLADTVTLGFEPGGSGVALATEGPEPCPPEQNLAYRAARLYDEAFGIGGALRIGVVKRIPAGAGLGGGSSDAAAVLRGLSQLTGRGTREELARIGTRLGADVPFFLAGGLAIGRGRGDEIEPLPDMPSWPIVLARAGRPLATADVYREARAGAFGAAGTAVRAAVPRLTPREDTPNILRFLQHLRESRDELPPVANDLYAAAARLEPRVAWLLERLRRTGGHACMTGSGSTVFALYAEERQAEDAVARLAAAQADLDFVHRTRTLPATSAGGSAID